jgi:hypothetical protein
MTAMVTGFAPQVLPAAEKLARLRLARSENVGPITFRQLLERYGSGLPTHPPTPPEKPSHSQYVTRHEMTPAAIDTH